MCDSFNHCNRIIMKIFETRQAPNPRRVRIFLAEKGVDMEYVEVDIQKGENLAPEYRAKDPLGKVPLLELDDGTCLSETVAICRYFETLNNDQPLMGVSPLEQARIEMWNRRMELNFFFPVAMAFRHTSGYFADRETVFKDWGEANKDIAEKQFLFLNKHLASHEYIAGAEYSIADITALCAVDFARVIGLRVTDELPHLQRWHQAMQARPSYKA